MINTDLNEMNINRQLIRRNGNSWNSEYRQNLSNEDYSNAGMFTNSLVPI